MYLLGYSLNNLTLDGDDDRHRLRRRRCHRDDREHRALHRGRRERRCAAALKGAAQIGFTIISLTVSLIAVLIPLLFMGDVIGRLFREFAITLAVTIVISAIVSLTLTASLSAQWLEQEPHVPAKGIRRHWQLAFDRIIARYDSGLRWVLDRPAPDADRRRGSRCVLDRARCTSSIPKGLFPTQDTGAAAGRGACARVRFVRAHGRRCNSRSRR